MLGEALRLIRVFHDLKQTEAARDLGISKSYLSEIESGAKDPTLQLINRYAEVFNLPASSILFFAETVGSPTRVRARRLVAGKILSLLRYLDEREGRDDEAA